MVSTLPELHALLTTVVRPLAPDTKDVVIGVKTVPHLCLCIRVEASDLGRVVGKHGRTVEALRTFVAAAGSQMGQRVRVCVGAIGCEENTNNLSAK